MSNTTVATRPQIFLSFAATDQVLAEEIRQSLELGGLDVVRLDDLKGGIMYSDTLRDQLRRSAAVVVAFSHASKRHEMSASVLFEIGAAVGADKPIFVVVDEPFYKLPFGAPGLRVLPISRIDEIGREIAARAA